MGRYLAIDYGTKRCGMAVSDPLKIFASPLVTVASHELMHFLVEYLNREEVECVVVGRPTDNRNKPSESYIFAERFVKAFRKRFPGIKIVWEDERSTSSMASSSMIEGGFKKSDRRRKENIDKISAAFILRSFMERENI